MADCDYRDSKDEHYTCGEYVGHHIYYCGNDCPKLR